MNIDKNKIKALIEAHGKANGYSEKSYIPKFCEDFELNYIQWGNYARGTQKAGIKIIYNLMNFFPNLNLNWLLKDDPNMFLTEHDNPESEVIYNQVKEVTDDYKSEVTNIDLMKKLNDIEDILKKGRIVFN